MCDELTREDVEAFRALATHDRIIVDVRGQWVGAFSALSMMVDHDAAQRATIQQRAERIKALETALLDASRVITRAARAIADIPVIYGAKEEIGSLETRVAELTEQLAEARAEVATLRAGQVKADRDLSEVLNSGDGSYRP